MDLLGIGMKNQYLRSSKSYRDVYFCYLAVARDVFFCYLELSGVQKMYQQIKPKRKGLKQMHTVLDDKSTGMHLILLAF